VIIRVALLGGDSTLAEELRAALSGLPEIALLAAAHAADADVLLAADSSRAAAGDLVRNERSRRADARILLVAPEGSESAAQQALDCGAVGFLERPIEAPGLRQALAAAGAFDARASFPSLADEVTSR
jgi:ActR/RegA family two-component response regulator